MDSDVSDARASSETCQQHVFVSDDWEMCYIVRIMQNNKIADCWYKVKEQLTDPRGKTLVQKDIKL